MHIIERAELLSRTPIFEDLETEHLASVAALVEEREYGENEVLFQQGEPGTDLLVVAEGRVAARRGDQTLFTAEPARTVGDLSLLDGLPRPYAAVALTGVRVLALSRQDFFNLLEERFGMARGVLAHLSRSIRALNERLGEGDRRPASP